MEPLIAWFVKKDGEHMPATEHYAGTYTPSNKIRAEFRVWNNKGGKDDLPPIKGVLLMFYFDTVEDNALLEYCNIVIDGIVTEKEIVGKKGYVACRRDLDGIHNDGAEDNTDNYMDIVFEFDAGENRIKANDLKNMYFELISSEDN